jgi:iron only hydrogenase large subunit-like protein
MKSFISLYEDLLKNAVTDKKGGKPELKVIDCDKRHLDCLLSPKAYPPVIRLGKCTCSDDENQACSNVCFFNAIKKDKDGNIVISGENCVGCGECITSCRPGNLSDIKETLPIFDDINKGELVYAMIAPAYISQFSNDVSPGKLRSAFKMLGFAGMIEVALFADILTLKEALEFDSMIESEDDYMLTSCCCPMWIAMIKKVYDTLVPHLPPSVSPMVACGRAIKTLHPEVKTVFIGPCIAKKAEAREKDVAGAVDYVLTFEETKGIFDAAELNPADLKEDLRDHSSGAGRIYARTAGVSEAVKNTLQRLKPDRNIPLNAQHADGVPDCKAMLRELLDGKVQANFIEGMGCKGGCIGGPKALIDREEALGYVNEYASSAQYKTPVDNPFVRELLEKLGFDTIESLLEGENIFTRDFDKQIY